MKRETAGDPALRQALGQGFALLRQGRAANAVAVAGALLAEHPRDPEVLFLACEASLASDDPEAALDRAAAANAAAPGQWPLLLKQADILLVLRRRAEARATAAQAEAAAADSAEGLWQVGKFHARNGDPLQAARLFERARVAGCHHPALLYDLASAQFYTGEVEAAEANLDTFLGHAPKAGYALYLRSTLRRQDAQHNHVADLRARLDDGLTDAAGRAACLFALAKELEDIGQPEASFAALAEGAALKRQTIAPDVASERAAMDAIRTAYDAAAMRAEVAGDAGEGAIFIVGMPRTGTTLVERMLGRQGSVAPAGELLDFGQLLAAATRRAMQAHPGTEMARASLLVDFAALGRDYMRGAREAAGGSGVFIDKMPINFLYCGAIAKALPKARIVHLVRDPMDTCHAVFRTLFNQAYFFSYDLEELADYYIGYHRLMRHWHAVMPGAILDVRYEELVIDTEAQARRLLAWCGLDWRPEVLAPGDNRMPANTASAAQVREPVHARSVGKWRRHEAQLEPLRQRLAAAAVIG